MYAPSCLGCQLALMPTPPLSVVRKLCYLALRPLDQRLQREIRQRWSACEGLDGMLYIFNIFYINIYLEIFYL